MSDTSTCWLKMLKTILLDYKSSFGIKAEDYVVNIFPQNEISGILIDDIHSNLPITSNVAVFRNLYNTILEDRL